ncbi:hypothetical protein [Paraburkholderia sp. HP33-1]|uniref:hypothetical protein n=1 Tax=Paraburkholderia sp. HP33-1 TaxID=2883243 RepID=UPI001F171F62|nr:hypothetical protein [Paraburkholderia sp. HP33-1]
MANKRKMANALLLNAYTPRESRAIFEDIRVYSAYPRPQTEGWITESFRSAKERVRASIAQKLPTILLLLEGFLQITGVTFPGADWSENKAVWELFLGALHSPRFLAASQARRYELTRCLLLLLEASAWKPDSNWLNRYRPKLMLVTGALERCLERYQFLYVKLRVVDVWMNWPGTNLTGSHTWFDLFEVRKAFGQRYTHEFHIACAHMFSLSRTPNMPLRKQLPAFMVRNVKLTLRARKDSDASSDFFRELAVDFLRNKKSDLKIETAISQWRGQFVAFAKGLISLGIFAEPEGGIAQPPERSVPASKTHTKIIDGVETRTKSITPFVMLPFTDEEALAEKREQVSRDVDTLLKWSVVKSSQVWNIYLRRVQIWQSGTPHPLTHADEKLQNFREASATPLANVAATLTTHGFLTREDCNKDGHFGLNALYRGRLTEWANELALPTTGTLLSFIVRLVIENTELTPSFLETLELYDAFGSRVGFGRTQGGYFLRGFKRRRGKKWAEQSLLINLESARTVLKLICLTGVCRRYLKNKKNDSARYLLLTTGVGFGYPTPIKKIGAQIKPNKIVRTGFVNELQQFTDCTKEYAEYLAKNFSLPALRSQMVTKLYLETHDTAEVARALGHVQFKYNLVCRYIPEPIIIFFMDRWIRIHQTRFVVEALVNSPYQLEASGLEDKDALERFMHNHCIPLHPTSSDVPGQTSEHKKDMTGATTLIGINADVMTLFCSISLAQAHESRPLRPGAVFWVELAEPLIAELEALRESRPDLAAYLDEGRRAASVSLVAEIIYE